MGWFNRKDGDGADEPLGPGATGEERRANPPPSGEPAPRSAEPGVPSRPDVPPSEFGSSMEVEGSVEGHGDLVLHGSVKGSIRVSGLLTIAESGRVQADCAAREVDAAGTVEGNIIAGERVHVRSTATVLGDIEAPTVVIDDGGGVEGFVQMDGPGDEEGVDHDLAGRDEASLESSWPAAGRLRPRRRSDSPSALPADPLPAAEPGAAEPAAAGPRDGSGRTDHGAGRGNGGDGAARHLPASHPLGGATDVDEAALREHDAADEPLLSPDEPFVPDEMRGS